MENNNGAVIFSIVLIVSAFLLIICKIAEFLHSFNREKEYILWEMSRAKDNSKYDHWHKKLRCRYLKLIPFVTERNVAKVYRIFFDRPKQIKKEKRPDVILHILAPSVIGICICALCLCGVSWAWFTASSSVGTEKIQSATFRLENASVTPSGGQAIVLTPDENGKYTAKDLAPNTSYTLRLDAANNDNASSKGYCCITVFKNGETTGTVYYTADIGKGTYTVTVSNETVDTIIIKVEPIWGDVEERMPGVTPLNTGSTIKVSNIRSVSAVAPSNDTTVPTPAPAQTETPNTTETPGTAEIPDTVETPDTIDTIETPGTAEAPDTNETPGTAEAPDTTDTTEASDTVEASGTDETKQEKQSESPSEDRSSDADETDVHKDNEHESDI